MALTEDQRQRVWWLLKGHLDEHLEDAEFTDKFNAKDRFGGHSMTEADWRNASDPAGMIRWLEKQGFVEQLWEFTLACCRRVWDELPGDAFRRVVEHAEQIGVSGVDDLIAEAHQALDKLERKLRKASSDTKQAQLNRQIGFGRMVLAFEYQVGAEAARSISNDLLEWADNPEFEQQEQAALLRKLVPDPSHPPPPR